MTQATSNQGPASSFRLIYRSRCLIPAEERRAELGGLFSQARSSNKAQDVTGALLCADDVFVQVLEGQESVVRRLFSHIAEDPRHDEVALVDADQVAERVFSRWAMAEVAAEGEDDVALIAHPDGIAPAAGRRTTAEQDQVLERMRVVARGGASVL